MLREVPIVQPVAEGVENLGKNDASGYRLNDELLIACLVDGLLNTQYVTKG